jgi:hypothetical protein
MKYLYKYPQAAYPYANLVETSRHRGRQDFEYELIDTGVFDQDRYFDVFVEYAKASPEDILIPITIYNRGPEARNRLDGALLPKHAGDRHGAGAALTSLCAHGGQVRRAFPVDRLVDDPRG